VNAIGFTIVGPDEVDNFLYPSKPTNYKQEQNESIRRVGLCSSVRYIALNIPPQFSSQQTM
jgi:hypothetical protein